MKYGEAVKEYQEFLNNKKYESIAEAIQEDKKNLIFDLKEIDIFNPELHDYTQKQPEEGFNAFQEAFIRIDIIDEDDSINIGFTNSIEESLILVGDLCRVDNIGSLVSIKGEVVKADLPEPSLVNAIFECSKCGDRYEKEQDGEVSAPYKCDCGSRKFEVIEKYYEDTQKIEVETMDESSIKCELRNGFVENPDEIIWNRVKITGIIRVQDKKSKSYYIESLGLVRPESPELDLEID